MLHDGARRAVAVSQVRRAVYSTLDRWQGACGFPRFGPSLRDCQERGASEMGEQVNAEWFRAPLTDDELETLLEMVYASAMAGQSWYGERHGIDGFLALCRASNPHWQARGRQ